MAALRARPRVTGERGGFVRLGFIRKSATRFEKERFDSAKRAVENLFSDGRGAKTCLEKERFDSAKVRAR